MYAQGSEWPGYLAGLEAGQARHAPSAGDYMLPPPSYDPAMLHAAAAAAAAATADFYAREPLPMHPPYMQVPTYPTAGAAAAAAGMVGPGAPMMTYAVAQHPPSQPNANAYQMMPPHVRQQQQQQQHRPPPLAVDSAADVQKIPAPEQRDASTNGGGVSQELDYEISLMAEWLSGRVFSLYTEVIPLLCPQGSQGGLPNVGSASPQCSPAYYKFVSQILTSTRLPSSTVVAGVVYVERRLQMLVQEFQRSGGDTGLISSDSLFREPRTPYRLVVISLVLANKFLDDNTFTNKSWSDVTGIELADISRLESEWLRKVRWSVGMDRAAPVQGMVTKGKQYEDFWRWYSGWESFSRERMAMSEDARRRGMAARSNAWSQQCLTPPYSPDERANNGIFDQAGDVPSTMGYTYPGVAGAAPALPPASAFLRGDASYAQGAPSASPYQIAVQQGEPMMIPYLDHQSYGYPHYRQQRPVSTGSASSQLRHLQQQQHSQQQQNQHPHHPQSQYSSQHYRSFTPAKMTGYRDGWGRMPCVQAPACMAWGGARLAG